MPILISETEVKLERADLDRRIVLARDVDPTTGLIVPPARRPGLHLSGLLKYIAEVSKVTARLQEIADEEYPLRWLMGHAVEEFLASLYPLMVWQPGEVVDPVIMNPDGVSFEELDGPNEQVIEEFKHNRSKRYDGREFLTKKWLFKHQGMGYCLGYGARFVRWHVLYSMEWPDPVYVKYLYQFTDEDLAGMRRIVDSNRDAAIRRGYAE